MNAGEIKGKLERAEGFITDKAGELLKDRELEAEGEVERIRGKAREA